MAHVAIIFITEFFLFSDDNYTNNIDTDKLHMKQIQLRSLVSDPFGSVVRFPLVNFLIQTHNVRNFRYLHF